MAAEDQNLRFDGKVALVTGAGGGLGRDYARLLAERGARVLVCDNGSSTSGDGAADGPANQVVEEIKAAGGEAIAFTGDLSVEKEARASVEACIDGFGRIDAIVHNAGFAPLAQEVDQVSSETFARVLAIGTFAPFWIINTAWPYLRAQGGGRIVLTSSAAIFGTPNSLAYGTTKASMLGMGRSLAASGANENIFTNIILPTAATRMVDRFPPSAFMDWFRENLRTQQVAPVVAYLCHVDSALNGEILTIAGGRIARVRLLETMGDIGLSATMEEVRERLPAVFEQEAHFFPQDPPSRSAIIARSMGFIDSVADPYGYKTTNEQE
jgi:NAD(P)-dependent dehydrogenase (short-subunit alcohol dehydrogenase family)